MINTLNTNTFPKWQTSLSWGDELPGLSKEIRFLKSYLFPRPATLQISKRHGPESCLFSAQLIGCWKRQGPEEEQSSSPRKSPNAESDKAPEDPSSQRWCNFNKWHSWSASHSNREWQVDGSRITWQTDLTEVDQCNRKQLSWCKGYRLKSRSWPPTGLQSCL